MEQMKLKLNYDELTNCMRCGFCQPACPTFQETGYEAASPRGRIALMKAVTDGLMPPDASFRQQMDLCLGCRACEPVCPADVKYGQLLEQTRAVLEEEPEHHRWWVRIARRVTFTHLFPYPKRMRLMGGALKLYQRSGLRSIAQASVLKMLPEPLRQMEAILPPAASQGVVEQLGTTFYPAKGEAIATVGMFRGCIMDILFTETNKNTVKLLAEAGFNVVIPDTQQCCGALHAHSGELEQAMQLAKQNIKAFQDAQVDYIVSNAGGCGALLVEYDHLLHEDTEWAGAAGWFASRVKDVSQIIMEKGRIAAILPRASATSQGTGSSGRTMDIKYRVTYQDSCHLRNVMKAGNAPRDLLKRTADITFVELPEADRCCGSAGIYNIVQPEMSMQILDHKMEHVKQTDAHVLLTSNPGCLLQMKLGVERETVSDQLKVMHVVDFLHERLELSRNEG
jgi:glycolate oxidase iron-sulfur subunit